jgi:hypothetical protein
MQISYKPPSDRGVTQLMYVGDDDAVDKAVAMPTAQELGIGVVAAIVALQSKGITRLAATGIAAFIGYRAIKAQK